ncbi:hypothetical protein B566_EDAN006816 [Ephemera danica]|nr:hypothetical protein B566_EDAN006816 [Ephemera danica]
MSVTTYKLVLVGPFPGLTPSTEAYATTTWLSLQDDNNIAELIPLDADQDADSSDDDSPSQRARILLEELEKEGQDLEEALQDGCIPSEGLGVFPDLSSIPPVVLPEPQEASELPASLLSCLNTSADTEALLRDLEAMLPEVTPPQSPPREEDHTILTDLDELLFLRSLSLPDPAESTVQLSYLPPTPSSTHSNISPAASPYSSAEMLSPFHASSVALSLPSPKYTPSTPASSPYPASTTSWDSDSTSDPDWVMEDAPGPSHLKAAAAPRTKPYARAGGRTKKPGDRKERKKLQNKNAATRYRIKKKAEEDELLMQEDELAEINKDLQHKVDDLGNEIRIIKGLLRDQCKRLGILKD